MFEFDAAISLFNVLIFVIIASRMRAMGILGEPLVIIVMCLRLSTIFLFSLLLPYTRMIITLEGEDFLDAMRMSMQLSLRHIVITIRYVAINYFLYFRFIINVLIVVGIPLLLIYLALSLGILDNIIIQTLGVLVIIALILITAYINGIIEAFFTTYWYKVYTHLKSISD
ncbi:MAG: hypothetical protein H6765_02070 [Candidatus Peribacteria bacterium]|nr:MAG: hypothetical protein H6765_02070 [Candidatus Peribacteria bacterium]